MSSTSELKEQLEFVTEHLRIAKDNLEYLKKENEKWVTQFYLHLRHSARRTPSSTM